MKAVDASALHSILDSDLVWRRREISSLVSLSKTATFGTQRTIVRAAIPLLYAHWEGFGRECALRYLEFVSFRRKKFAELKPSFLYLKNYPTIVEMSRSSASHGISQLEHLALSKEETNKDDFRKRISTKSNLRSDVFAEILILCGLDEVQFEPYKSFIDDDICDPRNEIAHGRNGGISLDVFIQRRDRAFELMGNLQTVVVNSALNRGFEAS